METKRDFTIADLTPEEKINLNNSKIKEYKKEEKKLVKIKDDAKKRGFEFINIGWFDNDLRVVWSETSDQINLLRYKVKCLQTDNRINRQTLIGRHTC